MAGNSKEKVRKVQGAILERIHREDKTDYEAFSERLAEKLLNETDRITTERLYDLAFGIQTDFFKFNGIENKEKFLDKIYRDIKRFLA